MATSFKSLVKSESRGHKILGCGDFIDAPSCCDCCHESKAEIGMDMSEFSLEGYHVEVCCLLEFWVKDKLEIEGNLR